MKKSILLLFAALLPLVASAEKVEIDGIWYNLITKAKQAEVTFKGNSYDSYNDEYSGSITIPATVTHNGVAYSVTSIGKSAFYGCSSLKSITIPASVTSIGEYAFNGCSSLKMVINYSDLDIREGSSSNGYVAYYADRVINVDEAIDGYAFKTIEGVHYLTGYIGDKTELTLPADYKGENYQIGERAFYGCYSLTAITIPEGVTSIGDKAFYGCRSLTDITIPESVTSIRKNAFAGCSSLTAITLPEGVTSIGESAFLGCSSLKSITIPENSQLTSIGDGAFYGCSSLTAITIPASVTSIGDQAFENCSSLTTIVLPKSVKYIYSNAFSNCPELIDVYCYAETAPTTSANAFKGSYIEYATLHIPENAIESYKSTAPWSSFGTIIALGASITEITLSESSATLYEGESLTLVAAVTPSNADMNLISWSSSNPNVATVDNQGQVTAMAPGTTTITIKANDGSGVSASCEVEVKEKLLGKCATPVVNYKDGKVSLTCETEGAKVITTVANGDDETFEVLDFDLIPTYTLTAYATKENYEDSDVATLTLCWVPCDENHEESDGIVTIPSKPVLISARDGVLTLSGLAEGTEVTLYTTDGVMVAHQQSYAGEATFTVDTNQVYLVHIGDKVVKIGM